MRSTLSQREWLSINMKETTRETRNHTCIIQYRVSQFLIGLSVAKSLELRWNRNFLFMIHLYFTFSDCISYGLQYLFFIDTLGRRCLRYKSRFGARIAFGVFNRMISFDSVRYFLFLLFVYDFSRISHISKILRSALCVGSLLGCQIFGIDPILSRRWFTAGW